MMIDEEERIEIPKSVQLPQVVATPAQELEPVKEKSIEDLSDLVAVDKEDVLGKMDGNSEPDNMEDLTSMDEEDMDEVIEVDRVDIMGEPPESELQPVVHPVRRFRRTPRQYPSQPTTLGRINY